jgi:hypothetical protein
MYWNDEKRNMILIYGECDENASAVYADIDHVLCFLNQKTNVHINFGNVLWVAFSIPSGSLSLISIITREIPCINQHFFTSI